MANLLDIRRRIKSVKNTQQITKAMKMVSAAKLKRAQERAVSARPFATKMAEVLTGLASHAGEDFHHPLIDARGDERYLLVLVTADKGLAGAFNANLTRPRRLSSTSTRTSPSRFSPSAAKAATSSADAAWRLSASTSD
jgi:F-type H+-transporting ATPase subunit gamma